MKNQGHTAERTRRAILKAARKLFMDKGFSATSMSQLADLADVNQSLIAHHFENKQGLWNQVKEEIVGFKTLMTPLNNEPKNLKEFLTEAIRSRLEVYRDNPDLYRLISWERLEKTRSEEIISVTGNKFVENWMRPIRYLMEQKKIRQDMPVELIFTWVLTSTNGIIMDEMQYFKKNPEYREKYIAMIIEGLEKSLK